MQAKMAYASSRELLKASLIGIQYEIQANDVDELEYETVLKQASKGLAAPPS